jgi:hypothetical protein
MPLTASLGIQKEKQVTRRMELASKREVKGRKLVRGKKGQYKFQYIQYQQSSRAANHNRWIMIEHSGDASACVVHREISGLMLSTSWMKARRLRLSQSCGFGTS